jgi:Fe-S-cluster formation regulator IscX/YfhJ
MTVEPGLDLHEWETRWAELQEMAQEEPDRALPEIVRFIEQALRERAFDLDDPVVTEGEDKDVVANFFAARQIAEAVEDPEASVDPEDVRTALDDLGEIYDYLREDRRLP